MEGYRHHEIELQPSIDHYKLDFNQKYLIHDPLNNFKKIQ